MKTFTQLYTALDATTKTNAKVDALVAYFEQAKPEDAAWAVYFLTGRKLPQAVPSKRLREWAREQANIAEWMFDECYHAVGDMAETIALLLPDSSRDTDLHFHDVVESQLKPLRKLPEDEQRRIVLKAWSEFGTKERFVWNKLITGAFRVGVSQLLVTRVLARVAALKSDVVAHRLMGHWEPTADFYNRLIAQDDGETLISRPYPFFLAHPWEADVATLGEPDDWHAEWKWDGIRSELVRRGGQSFLWSRGEELVTERYPEIVDVGRFLPDGTVLDGELLPCNDAGILPFAALQKRIGRKTVGKKLLADVPVILMAYDLLEWGGRDVREESLTVRRHWLETLLDELQHPALKLSPSVPFMSWDDLTASRTQSRERQVEGLMLKRKNSPYRVGRVRGDWWKWKVEPYTIDAVLIYAQAGHGKRSGLFTDYTFAVWNEGQLVPIAKAYSGLTDVEIRQVDAFVRKNTKEKFGPVRTVTPELVFELGFEGIQRSTRHKSGIATRFPRMLRWRKDKRPEDADTLQLVHDLLPPLADGAT